MALLRMTRRYNVSVAVEHIRWVVSAGIAKARDIGMVTPYGGRVEFYLDTFARMGTMDTGIFGYASRSCFEIYFLLNHCVTLHLFSASAEDFIDPPPPSFEASVDPAENDEPEERSSSADKGSEEPEEHRSSEKIDSAKALGGEALEASDYRSY